MAQLQFSFKDKMEGANAIFPTFSPRYFYFSSLGTTNPYFHFGKGWQEAVALRNAASGMLGSVQLASSSKQGDTSLISNALQFLSTAADAEARSEAHFFKHFLDKPELKDNSLLQELLTCFSDDGIVDYEKFLAILKVLRSGKDDASRQLNATMREIRAMNDALKPILERTKIDATRVRNPTFLIAKLFEEEDYAEAARMTARSKSLHATSVLGNALTGKKRSVDASNFSELLNQNIDTLLNGNVLEYDFSSIPAKFRHSIPAKLEIGEELLEMAYEELEAENNFNPHVADVYNRAGKIFTDLLDTQQEQTKERQKQLKRLSQRTKETFSELDLLSQQIEDSTRKVDKVKVGKKEDRLIGLTLEVRKVIAEIYKEFDYSIDPDNPSLQHFNHTLEKFAQKDSSLRTKKDQQEYFEALKQAIDNARQQAHISAKKQLTLTDYAKILNRQIQQQFKLTMYAETEYNAARGIKNIGASVGEAINGMVVGKFNGKADTLSSIHLGRAYLTIETDEDLSQFDSLLQRFLHNYEKYYEEEYKKALKNVRSKSEQQLLEQLGLSNISELGKDGLYGNDNAYSVMADASAHKTAWQHAYNNFKKGVRRHFKEREIQDQLINSLSDFFIIENSVKHSDYNIIGRGFSGGSLGAGLAEQLINISDLAQLGGFSTPDIGWLMFAVLNCGSGMIGAGNKKSLEDYFSVFASMLMFRSSSDLMAQVRAHANNYVTTASHNTIRLYTFQDTYVTSSYILRKTHEAMQQIAATTNAAAASNYASQAIIQNNVSEPSYHPWPGAQVFGEFASANYSAVSINVQLLAGFLDLLDNLESIVSGLPI